MRKNLKFFSKFSMLFFSALLIILLSNCKKEVTVEEEIPGPPSNGQVYDVDGNKYSTVIIGTQEWFSSNLKTTRFRDGTSIPLVTDKTAWSNLYTPGYCWYNNDAASNKSTYGALYSWTTVNDGKPCPTGWHVPSDAEWTILIKYLGESVAGMKLKETGTSHWYSNISATNATGFTAVPGGYRYSDGNFYNIGYYGDYWSTTENSGTSYAWSRSIYCEYNYILRNYSTKQFGFSVRCLRD